MMQKFKLITLILASVVITGCIATKANTVKPNYVHDIGIGYFVVSVTHDGSGDSTLLFRERSVKEYTRIDAVGLLAEKSDFSSKHPLGRVIVVAVPPGKYEISGFGLFNARQAGWEFATDLSPLKFNIRENESVYLGSIHISEIRGVSNILREGKVITGLTVQRSGLFGMLQASGVNGLFYDGSKRDIEIYKRKYKSLKEVPLIVNPLSALDWNGKHIIQ